MWQIHPVLSDNVIVRGVKIIGHGPNTDGVNPSLAGMYSLKIVILITEMIVLPSNRAETRMDGE